MAQPATGCEALPVCIFAKPPVAGAVKTRLIPALSANAAADLACAMLLDVWQTVEACPGVCPILVTTERGNFPVAVTPDRIWLQGEGDLGERIERIVTRALFSSPAVLAIGADSPALTPDHLAGALAKLESNDAVLGPAPDGGFYLLGLRRCPPGLFSALPWSSAETCAMFLRRLQERRFSVAELEPLFDVDTPEDLLLLAAHLNADPSAAPATRIWCARNGIGLVTR